MTTLSPVQHQKRIRLLQARTLLVVGGQSVARAAFDVGYESPTQFNREYAPRSDSHRDETRNGSWPPMHRLASAFLRGARHERPDSQALDPVRKYLGPGLSRSHKHGRRRAL